MRKLITSSLILLSSTIFAQDQIAKETLERLNTTTRSYENLTINFEFNYKWGNPDNKKAMQIDESFNGILITKGDKFLLEVNNQIIINDGETQWIYLADMNEVQIINNSPEDNMMNPNKLLATYEEDYKYTYVGTVLEKGKRLQIINLFPKKSQEFIKITIAVDATRNQLERVTAKDKNGASHTYLIKSFKSNTIIKPFNFNIADFPDVEVIDLR